MDLDMLASHVRRAKDGDPLAWIGLVDFIKKTIIPLFRRRLRGDADADDLIQETCLRVFIGLRGLRDNSRFPGFVYRTAERILLDEHRRRVGWRAFAATATIKGGQLDSAPIRLETQELINHCYQWLAPADQPYFTDLFVNDLADAKITARHGCSQGALRIRRHRIRGTLRPRLARALA